jgi:hypothetical protein
MQWSGVTQLVKKSLSSLIHYFGPCSEPYESIWHHSNISLNIRLNTVLFVGSGPQSGLGFSFHYWRTDVWILQLKRRFVNKGVLGLFLAVNTVLVFVQVRISVLLCTYAGMMHVWRTLQETSFCCLGKICYCPYLRRVTYLAPFTTSF